MAQGERMELGVQVNGDYEHVAAIAAIAEIAGFRAVALADHYLNGTSEREHAAPMYDSLTQLAALARDTSTVELLTLVSPVTMRHPAVLAKTMSTIDELSGGRFALGIGTGWHVDEHAWFGVPFPERAERFARLEDALGYLTAYLWAPEHGYRGRYWKLAQCVPQPRPRPGLRLVVGGVGRCRTPELAGRFAGEYNLADHDPDNVRSRLAAMRQAAESAGRDPDAILISTAYRMIGGVDAAEIDEFLAEWGASTGRSLAEIREHVGTRIPMLTWDQHAERLDELEQLGFRRAYVKVITKSRRAFASAAEHLARLTGHV